MRHLALTFLWVLAIWMVASLALVIRKINKRWRRGPVERGIFWIVMGVNALGALVMLHGIAVEPRLLETTVHTVETAKFPPGKGLTIAQISDVHAPGSRMIWDRVEAELVAAEPDIIVFTGDLAREAQGYDLALAWFARLLEIAPLYAIRGNWDVLPLEDYFAGSGARELDGDYVELDIDGAKLNLVGTSSVSGWSRLYGAFRRMDRSRYTVCLGHSPDSFEDVARWGADLYLAGHTHGGQISLPLYGALWTGSLYGKKYERGFYGFEESTMYINRGLGMSDKFPPLRIGSRPELTIFLIRGRED